jgi:hypothetical protein
MVLKITLAVAILLGVGFENASNTSALSGRLILRDRTGMVR